MDRLRIYSSGIKKCQLEPKLEAQREDDEKYVAFLSDNSKQLKQPQV